MTADAATVAVGMASEDASSKRMRGASPKPPLTKRRKVSDESEVILKDTKQSKPNKPDIELASAMALASLAALSPNSKYNQPGGSQAGARNGNGETTKVEEDESRDKTQERGEDDGIRVAASASWETRSPKADMSVESLPQCAQSTASRRVHFHPQTKEEGDGQLMEDSPVPSRDDDGANAPRDGGDDDDAAAPHPSLVTPQTPMFHAAGRRGAFMPTAATHSPHRRFMGNPAAAALHGRGNMTPPQMPRGHHMSLPPPPPPGAAPTSMVASRQHPFVSPRGQMTPHAHMHHLHHHPSQQPFRGEHPHMHAPPHGRPNGHPAHHHMHPHHAIPPSSASPQRWAQRTRFMAPPSRLMQPALNHNPSQWICDYCNVAAFHTFEAACVHEEICKLYFKPSERDNVREGHAANRLHRPLMGQQSKLISEIRNTMSHESMESAKTTTSSSSSHSVMTAKGPRTCFSGSMCMALDGPDQEWLSELNCYIRKECIEVFTATEDHVARTSKRGRISLSQVGIQCCFCKHLPPTEKGIAAVSFPTSLGGIYESVKRWQKVHLGVCPMVPPPIRERLTTLVNNNEWVPTTRQYWADSARALGMIDTPDGIRFSKDPKEIVREEALAKMGAKIPMRTMAIGSPGRNSIAPPTLATHRNIAEANRTWPSSAAILVPSLSKDSAASEMQDVLTQETSAEDSGEYIVFPSDVDAIPPYVYYLMRQVEPCRFTEADRFVARSKGPVGYPGFQCRHCNGHAGLGKYFPVSSKSFSTNSTSQNIHAHVLKCRKCPDQVKDRLVQLKIEKGRSPRMEPGWRRVFFEKVWGRLHG